MTFTRALGLMAMSAVLLMLTACMWNVKASKKAGQSVEGEISISGEFLAPRMHAVSMISADDLYIDTSGTDFALSSSGNVALTLTGGDGAVIASQAFPWVKSGSKLVFRDPAAVHGWLSRFPSAAAVKARLSYGNTPADGSDHVLKTALVYQGTVRASTTRTFGAECMTRYHTRQLCHSRQ